MVKVNMYMLMGIDTKDNGRMIIWMVKVNMYMLMGIDTKDNGRMII